MKKVTILKANVPTTPDAAFTFLESVKEKNTDIWFDRDCVRKNGINYLKEKLMSFAMTPSPETVSLVKLTEDSGDYKQAYFPHYFRDVQRLGGSKGIFVSQKDIDDFAYIHTDRNDPLLRKEGFMAFLKDRSGNPIAVFVIGQGDDIQYQIAPVSAYDGSVSEYWNVLLPS